MTLLTESILSYLISLIPIKKLSTRLLEANDNVWNSVKISQAMPLNFTFKVITLSLLSQILAIIFMYYALEMVNIHLPFSVAAWLLALVAIIAMLPLTIGGIGVREISLIFILNELYGVPAEASLLVSTVILLIGSIIFGAILGGYYAVTYKGKPIASQ
ncbi:membrane protein [Beggiatoa sp. PS]|nr:membrane protein [Beggiatoa sp. PS]